MTSSIQGIIIALLIAFLIGILMGYSFMQARARKQAEALKVSQRRLTEIEQSHELRLRETTEKLRKDYEAELAETIEHYQDQLSQKTIEMEQIYETRFRVLQHGDTSGGPPKLVGADLDVEPANASQPPAPLRGTIEPVPSPSQPALTQPELLHLKKQYELRLKEAAQKLQKAYEKQLADHARKARADIYADYEKRLADKTHEYEEQLARHQAQLEQNYAERQRETQLRQAAIAEDLDIPTPSEIMGTGDETTVTLPPPGPLAGAVQRPGSPPQYSQAEVAARIREATEQLRAEYDQRLARQLEKQQEQFDIRLQDLDAEHKQAIEDLTATNQIAESSFEDGLFGDDLFNLNEEIDNNKDKDKDKNDGNDDDFGPFDLSDISQLT